MILFIIPHNRVLEGDVKKEPYWNRIPDTRFYLISCIIIKERESEIWILE